MRNPFTVLRFLMLGAAVIFLNGCDEEGYRRARLEEQRQKAEQTRHNVLLVAEAPDGTKLWCKHDGQGSCDVYFSSSGAQYEERHGKHTDTIEVPNADGE